MISLDEAKTIVEEHDSWPPMTDSPRANFLLDVAQRKVMAQPSSVFGDLLQLSDWENVKEDYKREVEAYQSEEVEAEPYTVEQLEKAYLND